jgi:hypothetical protein
MENLNSSGAADSRDFGGVGGPSRRFNSRLWIWMLWTLATVVGMVLGFPSRAEIGGTAKPGLLGFLLPGKSQAILGLTLGMAQSLILLRVARFRQRSNIDLRWIVATVAGTFLGGLGVGVHRVVVFIFVPQPLLFGYSEILDPLIVLLWPLLSGLTVGVCQYLVLDAKTSLWWIVLSMMSWLVGFATVAIPLFFMPYGDNSSRLFQIYAPISTGVVVGMVTGAALLRTSVIRDHPGAGGPNNIAG